MTRLLGKWRPATVALALAVPLATQLALSGCAAGGMGDQLPQSMGGLPPGAPARPTQPQSYPAVHDIPAARSAKPLDDAQQLRLQNDLQNLRDSQLRSTADPDAPAPAAAKKNAASPKAGQSTGAKTNP